MNMSGVDGALTGMLKRPQVYQNNARIPLLTRDVEKNVVCTLVSKCCVTLVVKDCAYLYGFWDPLS